MLKYKIPQIVTLILNPSGFYVDPINPPKSLIYSKKEENHY